MRLYCSGGFHGTTGCNSSTATTAYSPVGCVRRSSRVYRPEVRSRVHDSSEECYSRNRWLHHSSCYAQCCVLRRSACSVATDARHTYRAESVLRPINRLPSPDRVFLVSLPRFSCGILTVVSLLLRFNCEDVLESTQIGHCLLNSCCKIYSLQQPLFYVFSQCCFRCLCVLFSHSTFFFVSIAFATLGICCEFCPFERVKPYSLSFGCLQLYKRGRALPFLSSLPSISEKVFESVLVGVMDACGWILVN